MTLLTLARTELRRFTSAGRLRRAALIAVLLIPLLYGGTYLWAFWDPDGQLDAVPVALAVEDRAVAGPDGQVWAGADLAASLERREVFAWRRMEADEARAAVDDGRYALALIVPADFSAKLVAAGTGEPEQAALEVRTNDAVNYLAGRLGTAVLREVRAAASAKATREYLDSIFLASSAQLLQARSAADGAARLAAGLDRLDRGSSTLADSVGEAAAGAKRLGVGVAGVADGSRALQTGAQRAASGTSRLADGLEALRDRAAPLPNALTRLTEGAAATADGAAEASTATTEAASAAANLEAAATGLAGALQAYATSGNQADLGRATVLAEQVRAGSAGLATGLATADSRLGALAVGSRAVADGLATASSSAAPLTGAIQQASGGAARLELGVADLAAGTERLASALTEVQRGATKLGAGTTALAEGSTALAEGASRAASGGTTLAAGLERGVAAAPALTGGAHRHADVMSNPVRLDTVSVNPAPDYGTGLSAYFLPLGLWLGAWLAYLFIAPLNRRAVAVGTAAWRVAVAGWLPVAALALVQATVLVAVVRFGLGLQPANGLALTGLLLLSAVTFAAVLQMLISVLGAPGRLLGIVLLVLQLVTAGGTYPIETEPGVLRWLSPLLPMTHMVRGLRAAVLGGDAAALGGPALVLAGYLVGSLVLTTLAARRARMWTPGRLWPELELVVR